MSMPGVVRVGSSGGDDPGTNNACNVTQPCTVAETGLSEPLLTDLLCKHLYDAGSLDTARLIERLALAGPVLDELLAFLRKDGRVEVLGQTSSGGGGLRYGLTERGRSTARDALGRSGYIG
ncbi:MAG TPA: hypothetical protein VER09_04440, partial [Pseudomonas sp.]|nr:hypothetical protein [Pseudomonas sp.]